MSSGCLFCKIVTGLIPTERVYEDEACIAFPDINPQALTHVLVVPKEHVGSLAEVGPEHTALLGKLMVAAAEVARQLAGARLSGGGEYRGRGWADG